MCVYLLSWYSQAKLVILQKFWMSFPQLLSYVLKVLDSWFSSLFPGGLKEKRFQASDSLILGCSARNYISSKFSTEVGAAGSKNSTKISALDLDKQFGFKPFYLKKKRKKFWFWSASEFNFAEATV